MMTKYKLIILGVLALGLGNIQGQGIQDYLRFSQPGYQGQGRFTALAGAMSGVGNDLSSISQNPAAASIFRMDEFGVSVNFYNATGYADYYDKSTLQNSSKFLLDNIGYVKKLNPRDPYSATVSISYNQGVNFRESQAIVANNPESSVIDAWIRNAEGINPDNLYDNGLYDEGTAYYTFLIDYDPSTGTYDSQALGNPKQKIEIDRRGGKGEVNITYADVVNKKLHWGLSLVIPTITYRDYIVLEESGFTGDSIHSFVKENYFSADGVGVGARFGLIYKPNNIIRLAASIKTPEAIFMTGQFETIISARFANSIDGEEASVENPEYFYTVYTPPSITLASGIVMKKIGFIDIDLEYLPFTWGGFSRLGDEVNKEINSYLNGTLNARFGVELKADRFYARGGYNFLSSPYNFNAKVGRRDIYAVGMGYRKPSFSIDLSYNYVRQYSQYYPYASDLVNPVQTQLDKNNIALSFSLRM